MKIRKTDQGIWVFVEKGDLIMKSLTDFCTGSQIYNGFVTGIGAINNVELGVFDPESKSYNRQIFPDTHELISCMGNITLKDDQPFIHAHVMISDHNMKTRGGHLFEANVAVVGEFFIQPVDSDIHREMDSNIGLATWHLTQE